MEAEPVRRAKATLLLLCAGAAYALVVVRASSMWLLENSALKPLGYAWLGSYLPKLLAAGAAAGLAFLILRMLEAGKCSAR